MAVRKAIKEEKEEKPFNINDLIKDVADSVNDRLRTADNKLIIGGDSEEMSVPYWVRTGIPQLDYAVGGIIHPGFPGARIIEIFGGEGASKSTLTIWLTKCAINQLDTFAVYQDAERVLTDEIIRGTGINMERVILQHPDVLEEVFESQEAIIEKLEEQKTKRPVVMVLDSVAACSTKSEIDGDYGDSTMGIHARIMSQAMRKIKSPIFTNNVFSIFVNQIRDKMNVTYGKNTTTSGGKSLPFYASVRIELAKIGAIKDSSKNATGVTIQATIVKNKVAPPLKKVTFDVLFAQDDNSSYPQIDIWGSTLDWLKDNELIGGTTGRYEVDGRSMYKNQARTLLQENPELFQQLVDMAYSVGKEKQE